MKQHPQERFLKRLGWNKPREAKPENAILSRLSPEVRVEVQSLLEERERAHSEALSAMQRSRDDLRSTLQAALVVIERAEQVTARVSSLMRHGYKVPAGVPHYRSTIAGTNGHVPPELFKAAFTETFSENEKLEGSPLAEACVTGDGSGCPYGKRAWGWRCLQCRFVFHEGN